MGLGNPISCGGFASKWSSDTIKWSSDTNIGLLYQKDRCRDPENPISVFFRCFLLSCQLCRTITLPGVQFGASD